MGWLSDLGGLASSAFSAYKSFTGDNGARQQQKDLNRLLKDAAGYSRALADPTQPAFQKLYNEELQSMLNAYSQGLRDLRVQQSRQKARGVPTEGLSDKKLATAFMQAREQAPAVARDRARDVLQKAASAAGIGIGGSVPAVNTAINVDVSERDRLSGGIGALETGIKAFEGLFNNRGSRLSSAAERDIASNPDIFGAYYPTGSNVRVG